jgi:hypothetical protein
MHTTNSPAHSRETVLLIPPLTLHTVDFFRMLNLPSNQHFIKHAGHRRCPENILVPNSYSTVCLFCCVDIKDDALGYVRVKFGTEKTTVQKMVQKTSPPKFLFYHVSFSAVMMHVWLKFGTEKGDFSKRQCH